MLDTAESQKSSRSASASGARPYLDPLFSYIWRNSRREQLFILAVVVISLPFYFYSLELPKSIVNNAIQGRAFAHGETTATLFAMHLQWPALLGGGSWDFPGLSLERYAYLFVLSGLFLVLVLINGAFKYVINMRKGMLGERMLRRLRFDLFAAPALSAGGHARVKPAEVATMIKDEVEPIGGFVGDAFIQPVFLAARR